jgi:hypothetical protein
MTRLRWYRDGLWLTVRLFGECFSLDHTKPLPSVQLRDDIRAFHARRPRPIAKESL